MLTPKDKLLTTYFALTPKGRKIASLGYQIGRGSILNAVVKQWKFRNGAIAVLAYFGKYKNQPRSVQQIIDNLPFGFSHVSQRETLRGVAQLIRRGYIKHSK